MSKKDTPYAAIKKPVSLLFGGTPTAVKHSADETDSQLSNQIALAQIKLPPSQPRRYFDQEKLEELSRSIQKFGILEPLLVRPLPDGNYELVAGERRLRAAQLAGLTEVPVVVREMDDMTTAQVRLIENLQREDLNPLEETEGILELLSIQLERSLPEVVSLLYRMQNLAKGNVNQNVSGNDEILIAQDVFDSLDTISWSSFVTSRLPLLKLPSDVLSVLRQGKIEYTKARAVARVKDEEKRQELLQSAISEDLSLTQINERIQASKETPVSNSLKERYKQAIPKLQKAHVWDNPKKQKILEKLLVQIEALIEE